MDFMNLKDMDYLNEARVKFLRLHGRGSIRGRELNITEIREIEDYLKNPNKSGIWKLTSDWNPEGSLSRHIINEIDAYFKKNEKYEFKIGKSREIIINPKKDSTFLDKIKSNTRKCTFIIRLFTYIHLFEKSKSKREKITDLPRDVFDTEELILFEMLDLNKIKKKYSNAYNLFLKHIYLDNFEARIFVGLFIYKEGYAILTEEIKNYVTFISLNYESIETIKLFLEETRMIKNIKIERIFSPEEELFKPYMLLIENIYEKILEYDIFKKPIDKAISEYKDGKYSHCIGTIGIMAEDILIQIDETLFREEARDEQSLGQRLDQINKKINSLLKTEDKSENINPSDLFSRMTETLENIGKSDNNQIHEDTLKIIRQVLQYTKEKDKNIKELVKKSINPNQEFSIFPRKIRTNLNELLRYRNAISHKSRSIIPIGSYEAKRSVYCVITLILWWANERNEIDWKMTKEEIIEKIIERNN